MPWCGEGCTTYTTEGSVGSTKAAFCPCCSCCSTSPLKGCWGCVWALQRRKKTARNVPQPPALKVREKELLQARGLSACSSGWTVPSKKLAPKMGCLKRASRIRNKGSSQELNSVWFSTLPRFKNTMRRLLRKKHPDPFNVPLSEPNHPLLEEGGFSLNPMCSRFRMNTSPCIGRGKTFPAASLVNTGLRAILGLEVSERCLFSAATARFKPSLLQSAFRENKLPPDYSFSSPLMEASSAIQKKRSPNLPMYTLFTKPVHSVDKELAGVCTSSLAKYLEPLHPREES